MTFHLKNTIICFFVLILFASCGKNRVKKTSGLHITKTGKVDFYEGDFGLLLDKAAANQKPIFVDVYADWCLPCKQMDKFVFTNDNLAKYLNDNFINYKMDSDGNQGDMIKAVYGVQILPSLIFLDNQGELLKLKEGYMDAKILLSECKSIMRKNKRK